MDMTDPRTKGLPCSVPPAGRALPALALLVLLVWCAPAAGGQPPLRWGGDRAGGAPYIYGPPGREKGFEVDLAEYLAAELGRKPEFVNGDWDALPDALGRGNLDIVLNGYEYSPGLEARYPSTIPYFIYTLRLIARAGDDSIRSWDDLRGDPGKRVGVLQGSAAQRYVERTFGPSVRVFPAREVDETFQLVEEGKRLDATVQDSPAAVYFVQSGRLPRLRVVGEPVAPNYYVILTRKNDAALRERLNAALRKGLRTGKLKEIYTRYHLWGPEQERLAQVQAGPWPPPDAGGADEGLSLRKLGWKIVQAAATTVALAFCAMPLAILLGVFVAVGRLYGPWFVRGPLAAYVEVLRGTPLLLQMYVLFYLLPQLADWVGWAPLVTLTTLPPFVVGVLGLAINYSAYEAENYRAGLLAIPRGQLEAALALGMTRWTALRRVIIPQAMRLVVPPVTNDFIALFKDTSICSVILITELTGLYYQSKWDRGVALELALVVAVLYLLMSYPLSLLARRLEKRQHPVNA
jgi:polar amino acid transport system substrate-binding protein